VVGPDGEPKGYPYTVTIPRNLATLSVTFQESANVGRVLTVATARRIVRAMHRDLLLTGDLGNGLLGLLLLHAG